MALVPFILALGIVPPGDEFRHVLPVGRGKVLRLDRSLGRVSGDSPVE